MSSSSLESNDTVASKVSATTDNTEVGAVCFSRPFSPQNMGRGEDKENAQMVRRNEEKRAEMRLELALAPLQLQSFGVEGRL